MYRKSSPFKIRDINIAIAYHNTGRSLANVAKEFEMSAANVERIHHGLVRHISRCIGLENVYFHTEKKNHSEQMSIYLEEYKYLLEENELRTEIILNDKEGKEILVLSTCIESELIKIRLLMNGCDCCEIFIDDLKAALRKLSTK